MEIDTRVAPFEFSSGIELDPVKNAHAAVCAVVASKVFVFFFFSFSPFLHFLVRAIFLWG